VEISFLPRSHPLVGRLMENLSCQTINPFQLQIPKNYQGIPKNSFPKPARALGTNSPGNKIPNSLGNPNQFKTQVFPIVEYPPKVPKGIPFLIIWKPLNKVNQPN